MKIERIIISGGMKKCTFIFFIVLYFATGMAQTYSSVVSDREIYGFLDWLTVNEKNCGEVSKKDRKSIYPQTLKWEKEYFILKDPARIMLPYLYEVAAVDSAFSDIGDKNFLYEQFSAIKDTIWHKSFKNSKLLRVNKKFPGEELYTVKYIYVYSIPLFSRDRKYVIILMRYFNCADDSGHMLTCLYKRLEEKQWRLENIVHSMSSYPSH